MLARLTATAATALSLTLQLFARSSGFLLGGLAAAGLFHWIMARRKRRLRLESPGFRSIASGMLTGLALPICSCGTLPVAIELKRQRATRESIAAFMISTPEDSPDAVFLTAGLFGWAFAAVRIAAGLLAAVAGGVLVIASEAWGPSDAPPGAEGVTSPATPRRSSGRSTLPRAYRVVRLWLNLARRNWNAPHASHEAPASAGGPGPEAATPPVESRPGAGAGSSRFQAALNRVLRRIMPAARNILSYGFGELLDELAWPLLFGFLVSGLLAVLLPADLGSRIPGGLLGQLAFAAIIAVPLNVCASGTIPLAAVLVSRGLSPAAALMIFLTGPLTNPATLLIVRREFGRKFLQSMLIACFSVALIVGLALQPARGAAGGPAFAGRPALTEGLSAVEIVGGVMFGAAFLLSLLRVGWRRGRLELLEALRGIVPRWTRRLLRSSIVTLRTARAATLMACLTLVAAAFWLAQGFRSVPPGSVALRQTLGRVRRTPLPAGWHWSLPPPLGSLRLVPAEQLLKIDIGFRASAPSDYSGVPWNPYSEYWHSIYTTSGDQPEESSFTTGDQNLVEVKAALHVVVSDAYQLAVRTREGVEAVRAPFLATMNQLLATRDVDRSLTDGRRDLENAARRLLQIELDRGGIPLTVRSVNILDFHPPQETVAAFRDVGSAAEEKERRIFEARGKLDSAIPLARGEAATELAAARSERAEKTSRAAGEGRSFQLQAAASASAPAASRLRWYWETIERAWTGRTKIIVPEDAELEILDLGGKAGSRTSKKGPPSQ